MNSYLAAGISGFSLGLAAGVVGDQINTWQYWVIFGFGMFAYILGRLAH